MEGIQRRIPAGFHLVYIGYLFLGSFLGFFLEFFLGLLPILCRQRTLKIFMAKIPIIERFLTLQEEESSGRRGSDKGSTGTLIIVVHKGECRTVVEPLSKAADLQRMNFKVA